MRSLLMHAYYIAKKDLKEYYMKPGTVSWGLLFPVVFTAAFLIKRGVYSAWVAPGLLALSVFFSSTSMTGSSIVFERRFGSFERLLLFPMRLIAVALGKSLGGTLFGLISSVISMTVIYLMTGAKPTHPGLLAATVILTAVQASTFGALLAFLVRDPSNIMTTFNLVRLPMIFLSGIIVPVTQLPLVLKPVAYALPLTYSAELIRYAYLGQSGMPPALSATVIVLQAVVFLLLTDYIIRKSIP